MKAKVDPELCIGCGLCADTCPEVFEMKDDKAVTRVNPVPAGSEEKCKEAKDNCPVEAIIVEE